MKTIFVSDAYIHNKIMSTIYRDLEKVQLEPQKFCYIFLMFGLDFEFYDILRSIVIFLL